MQQATGPAAQTALTGQEVGFDRLPAPLAFALLPLTPPDLVRAEERQALRDNITARFVAGFDLGAGEPDEEADHQQDLRRDVMERCR